MIDIELQRTRSAMAESVTLPIAMWLEALDELEALRQTRLVQQAEQEPFAYEVWDENDQVLILIYASYLKEAHWLEEDDIIRKLYAAPVRTKDLTDDEIWDLWESNKNETAIEFYEAIIAAYKEKNK